MLAAGQLEAGWGFEGSVELLGFRDGVFVVFVSKS